jgi:hypothetical protein
MKEITSLLDERKVTGLQKLPEFPQLNLLVGQ